MGKIVGEVIRNRRKSLGLSVQQLSEMAGISKSYLDYIESGTRKPSFEILAKIADALGISKEYLIKLSLTETYLEFKQAEEPGAKYSDPDSQFLENTMMVKEDRYGIFNEYSQKDFIPITKTNKIPVVGVIRAGEPILAEQNIIGYVELPADLVKDNGEYFGLRVVGDSMNLDRICEGDIAIVRRQDIVDNGDIAVVLIDDENATIKRFYMTNTTITLVPHSSNPEHKPRVIDPSRTRVKVLGKVVRAIINF